MTTWRPPDKNDNARGAAGIGGNQKHYGANIIPLRQPRRNCVDCGIEFRVIHSWHTRCAKCYRWNLAGFHNALAAAAIRGAR